MDAKAFFEVFPTLELKNKAKDFLEETKVTRVSSVKGKDMMRVYLDSAHIIPKDVVFEAEEAIQSQLFSCSGLSAKIIEKFQLSSQYTLETLIKAYRESMEAELQAISFMLFNILHTARITYPGDNRIDFSIEDNFLFKSKEAELEQYIQKVIAERCGMDVIISFSHYEAEAVDYEKENSFKVAMRVREIEKRAHIGVEDEPIYIGNVSRADAQGTADAKAEGQDAQTVGEHAKGAEAAKTAGDSSKKAEVKPAAKTDAAKSAGDGKFKKFSDYKKGGSFGGGRRMGDGEIKRSENPDVIYGRDIDPEAETIKIVDIIGEIGEIVIKGQVLGSESRDIKNEKSIFMFDVTDFTDTIRCKVFIPTEKKKEVEGALKNGTFVKIKGVAMLDKFDHEITIQSIAGVQKIPDFTSSRNDLAVHKRVELHCHTKMSDMDGVSEPKDIVKCAYKWGHKAIAITDHGVVQGFTDANHTWDDLWKPEKKKREEAGIKADKQDFFKVLYGVECYLVDDLVHVVTNDKDNSFDEDFVVYDIETTGLSPVNDHIIEFGAVKISKGKIVDRFSQFVNPGMPIPYEIERKTSITDKDVMGCEGIDVILPEFLEFCEGCVLVAHNAEFDVNFVKQKCKDLGLPNDFTYLDTLKLARVQLPGHNKFTLDAVAKIFNIPLTQHHRAVADAECTAQIFLRLMNQLSSEGMTMLAQINEKANKSNEAISKLRSHHCIILAKNDLGRIHLYHLISESHLTYFGTRFPLVPKSRVEYYRDGLIIGSACEAGELYEAIVEEQTEEQIARIVDFYDYLEIQPVGNNAFMVDAMTKDKETKESFKKYPKINSLDDIRDLNRKVVALGEQFHKPVVATCDVHFLNPEDEIYRRIIMAGKGFDDADNQAPLYLHTTDEMLEEFQYLGSDKAKEVVVTNTNMIADMCETISPVRPDKCPPVIPNSDQMLTDICYNRAHEIYGPDLPDIVVKRLERELNSIISNGYAVMYIIAQKLVWKSVEDGYLVGSRGSVGSSFVATMSGITEVNPLSPHYICPHCHFVDFDSDLVKEYGGKAGVDMPDRDCPNCGKPLIKEGFDIPFETFLGFKGDKEPDIDLNFSGEYQAKAHKYTEIIFGSGQTFRAGTISGLADKTAFGYVKKYFEEHNVHKRESEINRIVQGCMGVRTSTGQHPGGIVVLPVGEDICSFTPVQHPANKPVPTITTHFDYHSIDHNLLKLDILGHDDPTIIRMLQDITGLDPVKDIPLDGKDVMSLFQNTDALGITPEQIGGTKLGALGIPEFGTDFAMQMVIDAQPQSFSDLVRISGLSHGTDVWLGNAQDLIRDGIATISTAICTRDDIMTYLISKGVEPERSFKIMENVRKGVVAKGKCAQWDEWVEDMKAHDVPDWYIGSCKKIAYMFPKAHAAAYVMMAWRIAYCKIHRPQAYYSAYFSIRAKAFSYEIMCMGQAHLESILNDYKKRRDAASNREPGAVPLSNKEEAQLSDMRIVQEMYARGFEFVPIDLFKVKARLFQVMPDGKVMPSLTSIEGLGENAADSIVEAAKGGPFLSKDDFKDRAHVGQGVADNLSRLGILTGIPESNQISLFDFI